MGDAQNHHHQPTASRLGLRTNTGGEIVEVQGGHIVRSTGRKDRHSKVCTAKGPRDRRVRLSAHTAIQFYDVQDRLGYDRPSKAVDWLIKNAKSAIDELAELPAWKPSTNANFEQEQVQKQLQEQEEDYQQQQQHQQIHVAGPSSQSVLQMGDNNHHREPSFLPASMESDSIADTIKSFFPIGASAETNSNSSAMQFQSFQTPELLSRTNSHTQDLRLSLQSFQDPMLLYQHSQNDHHHHHHHHQSQQQQQNENTLFSGTPALGFDWSENQQTEIGRFPRMVSWNAGGDTTGGSGGTFIFNSPPLFGQNQVFSQRGPLQSSNTPSIRAWMDPPSAISADHHHYHQNQHHQTLPFHQSSMSGVGISEFTGFQIPARIQGEEEEHDGISDKPSSASSDSRH